MTDDDTVGPDAADAELARLAKVSSVLVLGDSMSRDTAYACTGLLSIDDPSDAHVVHVLFRGSPQLVVDRWLDHVGTLPGHLTIIVVNGGTDVSDVRGIDPEDITIQSVNANDLTGIGITLMDVVNSHWERTSNVLLCLDSLTMLLMYVDERVAYRFTRSMAGVFSTMDAKFHFHLDPSAHDPQTVNRLKSAFSGVVEVTEDGLNVAHL